MKKIIILTLFVFVLLVSNVYALGITPGSNTLFYGNETKQGYFKIVNNQNKDFLALLSVDGEFADCVDLSYDSIVFEGTKEFVYVDYNISFGSCDLKPGKHRSRIIVTEIPDYALVGLSDNEVVSAVGVAHVVNVIVPYPGLYVEYGVDIYDDNESVGFVVKVNNLGKLNLDNVYAEINIFNSKDEKVGFVVTDSKSINSKNKRELVGVWDENVKLGDYRVEIILHVDNQTREFEKRFSVGNIKVDIKDIIVKDFTLGDIAEFDILLSNNWGGTVRDVYAVLNIAEIDGRLIGEVKTESVDIEPYGEVGLKGFWDTLGISEGDYELHLSVYSNEKIVGEMFIDLQLTKSRLVVNLLDDDEEFNPLFVILVFVLGLIFLVNFILFYVFLIRKKNFS